MQLLVLPRWIDEQADAQIVVGDVGDLWRMAEWTVVTGIDDVGDRKRLPDAFCLVRFATADGYPRIAHGVAGEQLAANEKADRSRRMAEQLDDAHVRRELDFACDRTELQPLQRPHGVFGRIGIAARPG